MSADKLFANIGRPLSDDEKRLMNDDGDDEPLTCGSCPYWHYRDGVTPQNRPDQRGGLCYGMPPAVVMMEAQVEVMDNPTQSGPNGHQLKRSVILAAPSTHIETVKIPQPFRPPTRAVDPACSLHPDWDWDAEPPS